MEKLDILNSKIITELSSNDIVTGEELAYRCQKSVKTIQNRISQINSFIDNDVAYIQTIKGRGYKLIISDESVFKELLKQKFEYSENELLDKLISILIKRNDYIKADEIEKKLYISKSTLTKNLNNLRNILSKYNLVLKSKPRYGLKIVGSEFDYRRFISSSYVQRRINNESIEFNEYERKLYHVINKILDDELAKENYYLPSQYKDSFVRHLYVSAERISNGNDIGLTFRFSNSIKDKEKKIVDNITERLKEGFNVEFSKSEKDYLLLQLVAKNQVYEKEGFEISAEINNLVDKIFISLKKNIHIDFTGDLDFKTILALHLIPLKFRLENGCVLDNPLYKEIRYECINGYECALLAADVIEKELKHPLSEHEISYLALHFDATLREEKYSIIKKKIILVCSKGKAYSRMLISLINDTYGKYIDSIELSDESALKDKIKHDNYDYIFTTTPLKVDTVLPIIELSSFSENITRNEIGNSLTSDISNQDILSYFKRELFIVKSEVKDKNKALDIMLETIKNNVYVPYDFNKLVYEREKYFSTDLIDNIAFPHPNKLCTNHTFVAVMILDHSVFWGKSNVNMIFLTSINKEASEKFTVLYRWLVNALSNKHLVASLSKKTNYDDFINELLTFNEGRNI